MSYFEFISIINDFCKHTNTSINTIFELGSRDLIDAIKLAKYYNCEVYSFECNPDCLIECKKNMELLEDSLKNKIHLIEKAVCITNDYVTFYPFDLQKYNNMGSSSFYKIDFSKRTKDDPDYNRENCQKEIKVQGIRLDTFINNHNNYAYGDSSYIKTIDLLCMDLQGYELNAVKSLGDHLYNVKYIIAECCIENTYIYGTNFKDLNEYLAKYNFIYISSNLFGENFPDLNLKGYSEFDALFINENIFNPPKPEKLLANFSDTEPILHDISLCNSAICYLLRSTQSDVDDIIKSLVSMYKYFLIKYHYPVILIVESNFTDEYKSQIINSIPKEIDLQFCTITFSIPDHHKKYDIKDILITHNGGQKWPLGYRHMCRFWTGEFMNFSEINKFEYIWRMDSDAFLIEPIEYDIFKFMKENQAVYGFSNYTQDEYEVCKNMYEFCSEYFKNPNCWNPFLMYTTHVEIINIPKLKYSKYYDFYNAVDNTPGFYMHRWGDAPLRLIGITNLDLKAIPLNISYIHGNDGSGRIQQIQNMYVNQI